MELKGVKYVGYPSGIIWAGSLLEIGGYGTVSRNMLKALSLLDIPIHLIPIGSHDHQHLVDDIKFMQSIDKPISELGNDILLFVNSTPEGFPHVSTVPHRIKIGVTLFETDRIPLHWVELCNQMDKIWVPSRFNYHTFSSSGVEENKLQVVPYPIDVDKFKIDNTKNLFRNNINDKFKFLFVGAFDYRKGLDLLIRAYCDEFSRRENVVLVLKLFNPVWNSNDILSILRSYTPQKNDLPLIHVILEKIEEKQLIQLYSSCDCYVSTERANGWGYPAMEMMALGKPVVHINWGGNTEFMNESNSILIEPEKDFEFVSPALQEQRPREYAGHKWAVVRLEEVRKKIRLAFEDRINNERVSKVAQDTILSGYTYQKISEITKNDL